MLKALRTLVAITIWLSPWWLPTQAGAATDLVVQIQGESAIPGTCSSGNCTAFLDDTDGAEKTYSAAGIKIKGKDASNRARVVTSDGSQDKLELLDATITTISPSNTKYIHFWAQFSKSDNAPSGDVVRWRRSAEGQMIRGSGSPPGNWTQMHGLISADPIQSATRKTVLPGCTNSSCGVFTEVAMRREEDDYSLTGSRELRGELQFYMGTTGDQVKINTGYVMSVPLGTGEKELEASGIEQVEEDDEAHVVVRKGGGKGGGKGGKK